MYADAWSGAVIGAAIQVHTRLGPGLLESVYESCMTYELARAGVPFVRQKAIPVRYDDVILDLGFRADLLVGDDLIVELKAVDQLSRVHEAQLHTYMKLTSRPIGLLINFDARRLREGGIRRIVRGVPN